MMGGSALRTLVSVKDDFVVEIAPVLISTNWHPGGRSVDSDGELCSS